MEEEHSFAAKGVRPVWSPSEAAPEREAKRRSLYSTCMNFRPVVSTSRPPRGVVAGLFPKPSCLPHSITRYELAIAQVLGNHLADPREGEVEGAGPRSEPLYASRISTRQTRVFTRLS